MKGEGDVSVGTQSPLSGTIKVKAGKDLELQQGAWLRNTGTP